MKDIARELGISIGFVSKVLSGRLGTSSVSPQMQKRIFKKADELGYVPNRNAIRLLTGKNDTIGVFIHPWGIPGSDLVFDFLHGVTKGLMSTDYQTWLNIFEESQEFYRQLTLPQLRQRVDGLLVGGSTQTSWLLPELIRIKKARIPLITFFEYTQPGIVNICVDYNLQGRLPTEHLLASDCRKIIHIKVMESRYRGYADALLKAGLAVKPESVVTEDNFDIESGRRAVRKLLKAKTSFDGIVAQSDHQALGAIQELLAHNIRVPGDVRVTGVDNGPIALSASIPLTTVTSEAHNMGSLTVDSMLKMLARKTVKSMALRPRMVVRDSG